MPGLFHMVAARLTAPKEQVGKCPIAGVRMERMTSDEGDSMTREE